MKNFILFIILFFLIINSLFSATTIYGNAEEYAGNKLVFYKYSDRITFIKDKIFDLEIDQKGNFKTLIDINETTFVFAEFGIYYAYLYLEPNSSYDIVLPEYIERQDKDIFNPYYQAYPIHLGIKNMKKTDLNYLIMDFDAYYDSFIDYVDFSDKNIEAIVKEFLTEINGDYKDINNEYFNNYKKFRIANLKNLATRKESESIIAFTHFTKSPVLYDNPAYMDLFNNMYNSYFDRYLTSEKGQLLYATIQYGHRITLIHQLLAQEPEFRYSQFREMVILKGINDALLNRNLEWNPLLLTLDSLIKSTNYEIHKKIAQNIADNAVVMSPNTVAPVFSLPNINGDSINIKKFRGNYIYLQFANTKSYSSQLEFDLMKKIYQRYKTMCTFITVLTDEDKENAKKYIQKKKLEWEFLFTETNSNVLSMYNVDIFPLFFLIDTEGLLKLSPAPAPSENFEEIFFRMQ